jgi:hypothetical protein
MPADYAIDAELRLVRCRGWGRVTNEDLFGVQDRLAVDPAFDPQYGMLYDFTGVTDAAVTHDAIAALRVRDPFARGARQAVVVDSDVAFGLSRMYELLHELHEEEFRVFRDPLEAHRWLGIDPS